MEPRFWVLVLIFISGYFPLSIMISIRDFDFSKMEFLNPCIIVPLVSIHAISCIFLYYLVREGKHKLATPPVTIEAISNYSGTVIDYTVPYVISISTDFNNLNGIIQFAFFMLIFFCLSFAADRIFFNPVLLLMGYGFYMTRYKKEGMGCDFENMILAKRQSLKKGDICRIAGISETLFLLTEKNPED